MKSLNIFDYPLLQLGLSDLWLDHLHTGRKKDKCVSKI